MHVPSEDQHRNGSWGSGIRLQDDSTPIRNIVPCPGRVRTGGPSLGCPSPAAPKILDASLPLTRLAPVTTPFAFALLEGVTLATQCISQHRRPPSLLHVERPDSLLPMATNDDIVR